MKERLLKRSISILVGFLSVAVCATAQAIRDVRINEILVHNTDSYEDPYGHRVGWIELFNAGYSQVDIGGAYLKVEGREYRIPKNDKRTVIEPQGYLVFFAEGTSSKGTFHTNFRLEESNYVALYDQSGRGEAIDSLAYDPGSMKENVSYGWYLDSNGEMAVGELAATTPLSTNDTEERKPKSEYFSEADPSGMVMAITAMSVVFGALIILYLIFKTLGKLTVRMSNKKGGFFRNLFCKGDKGASTATSGGASASQGAKDEVIAAIALAIHLSGQGSTSRAVVPARSSVKAASAWGSKIHGLRKLPIKNNRRR